MLNSQKLLKVLKIIGLIVGLILVALGVYGNTQITWWTPYPGPIWGDVLFMIGVFLVSTCIYLIINRKNNVLNFIIFVLLSIFVWLYLKFGLNESNNFYSGNIYSGIFQLLHSDSDFLGSLFSVILPLVSAMVIYFFVDEKYKKRAYVALCLSFLCYVLLYGIRNYSSLILGATVAGGVASDLLYCLYSIIGSILFFVSVYLLLYKLFDSCNLVKFFETIPSFLYKLIKNFSNWIVRVFSLKNLKNIKMFDKNNRGKVLIISLILIVGVCISVLFALNEKRTDINYQGYSKMLLSSGDTLSFEGKGNWGFYYKNDSGDFEYKGQIDHVGCALLIFFGSEGKNCMCKQSTCLKSILSNGKKECKEMNFGTFFVIK